MSRCGLLEHFSQLLEKDFPQDYLFDQLTNYNGGIYVLVIW